MTRVIIPVLVLLGTNGIPAGVQYHYSGTVRNVKGDPIANALITIQANGASAETDAQGNYLLAGEIASVLPRSENTVDGAAIVNGALRLSLARPGELGITVHRLDGTVAGSIPAAEYPRGNHTVRLPSVASSASIYLIKITADGSCRIVRYAPLGRSALMSRSPGASIISGLRSAEAQSGNNTVLRASAAGYRSSDTVSTSLIGTYDFTLPDLGSGGIGTAGQEDGSIDRLATWGKEQYFWGDPGSGKEIPLVKVVTAVSPDAVDIALIFNPGFVDNTYGNGRIGWNKHTFEQLVKSDHVEISVRNGDEQEVFFGKIDMISPSSKAPSGYASLGPLGGDGALVTGTEDDILSFGTSMDDNLNYYNYRLFTDSPETDSVYTPNPQYPHWEYYAIYRISFDPAVFGPSGFGDIQMTSVHASPAKTKEETVTVTEKDPPADTDDPFTHTDFGKPPSDEPDRPGEDPPTDPPDISDDNPPTDPPDTETPPTDTTGQAGDPPSDEMEGDPGETPPGDVLE